MQTNRKLNIALLWLVFVLPVFFGNASLRAEEQSLEAVKDSAVNWVNQVRTEQGIQTLAIDSKLNEIAETHSKKMAANDLLSENDPVSGTPFERIRSSGLTDVNNLVVVAKAPDWDQLRDQLESQENLEKIISPEMTRMGVGIVSGPNGNLWLTIHMIERAITFTQFTLSQSNTVPARHSITIRGNTLYKKIRVLMVPPEGIEQKLALEHVVIPDANGDFEITLSFGISTGNFSLNFSVLQANKYKLMNSFSMDVR